MDSFFAKLHILSTWSHTEFGTILGSILDLGPPVSLSFNDLHEMFLGDLNMGSLESFFAKLHDLLITRQPECVARLGSSFNLVKHGGPHIDLLVEGGKPEGRNGSGDDESSHVFANK